jgi:hypothetical protein
MKAIEGQAFVRVRKAEGESVESRYAGLYCSTAPWGPHRERRVSIRVAGMSGGIEGCIRAKAHLSVLRLYKKPDGCGRPAAGEVY